MNKITHKERTEKNNIVCPNCHINIKVLTDDLILPMGDEWHDDMYISHEDEYLERKELQQRINKAIEILEKRIKENEEIDYVDMSGKSYINYQKEIIDILRGER